jgi:transcriptional regulator with XRE-family HTH domain
VDGFTGTGASVRPATIGQRIRAERAKQGLSLRQFATLSGLSKGFLSKVENGASSLDERRTLHAVADALRVPVAKLTGQPYDPMTKQEQTVRAALADIRDVLYGIDVGERYEDPARDLDALAVSVDRVSQLHSDCFLDKAGPLLAPLLDDLYGHAADRRGEVQQAALPLLVETLNVTRNVAHWAGEAELAYRASEQAVAAAALVEDPALLGFAQFGLVHSLGHVDGRHARLRAGALAVRGAEELQLHSGGAGPAAEMYGILHLTAAWSRVLSGAAADAEAHLQEATETARRTGDGQAYRLWFGPTNVAAWRVALAVEAGAGGGRVRELAREVDVAALPARERQAGHWINVGRGLAQDPQTAPGAVEAFRRARRLTPMRTRLNPLVRGATERLWHEVGGPEVRQFAAWLGIIPR